MRSRVHACRCMNVDVRASSCSLLLQSAARQPLLEIGLQDIKSGLSTQVRDVIKTVALMNGTCLHVIRPYAKCRR